jgi:hypothetical protein
MKLQLVVRIDNNNTFEKDYIQGRYGAIPFIGDLSTIIGN